jgi:transposase
VSIVNDVRVVWKGLSKRLQRQLNRQAMRDPDAELQMRCKIVRNLVRGEEPTRIFQVLGCARSQVYRIAHRFIASGVAGLDDRRAENGCTKVDEDYTLAVLAAVAGAPTEHGYQRPTWTQELLILVAQQETGVSISTSTMSRLLAKCGVRQGRPKPWVDCPWPKTQKTRRLNELRRLVAECPADATVLYVDEVDIHLNPKIGSDWMLRGQQKQVQTPGKNEKHYLAGALDALNGRVEWVDGPRKTGALFIALVDHLLKCARLRGKTLHLVLDNYRIHTSKAVAAAKARWGDRIVLHFLPPYCPDYNRIERLWKDLHDNVTRNHACRDMSQLLERVHNYLRQRRRGRHDYIQAA